MAANTAPVPTLLTRASGAPIIISRSLFRWQARRGTLDALTGQTGTLVRAATGTAVDGLGTTYTAGHSMPRWETRESRLGLRLAADDLTWPCNVVPVTSTILIRMSEAGTRTTSGAGLLYIGNDGQTGGRLIVDASSNQYRVTIHNGTTGQSVSLTGSTPTTDNEADFIVNLLDTGGNQSVRIARWLSGVETVTAYSSTVTRAAVFGTGAKIRANRVGSAGTQGSTWLSEIAWETGTLTYAEMLARL